MTLLTLHEISFNAGELTDSLLAKGNRDGKVRWPGLRFHPLTYIHLRQQGRQFAPVLPMCVYGCEIGKQ